MTASGPREIPLNLLRGVAMGAADAVPGVSGGTVALVVGIYPRLIASVRNGSVALTRLVALDPRGAARALRAIEWTLIAPLLAGIAAAILAVAGVLEAVLGEYPIPMAGLILGLVGGSTVLALRLLERPTPTVWTLMGLSAVAFFVLLGLAPDAAADESGLSLAAYFLGGAIAICAMILPGISGAFLLVAIGMYGPVLAALNDRDLAVIGVFILGCVVGLALFSRVLHWGLSHHYDVVLAVMIGLMIGSLRVLWPWPDGVASVQLQAPDEAVGAALALCAVGVALVLLVDKGARRIQRRTIHDEVDDLHAV
jgi:putative membrane protein